eukprot:gnl/MRDRNA2_/MRDRNA2_35234_c0_seq1.p1 gnl/MRDRNA2_/MRDRNA2_35234_c0~~gnl/MRDRNA2_/MRDRNA2_35234_c0_seq1.p1  ORF type:complete len:496 (-),score=141.46 gnl/MRDRNA2_/MRDRNA2_35234_c0_seq1:83-1570(-)
MRIATILIILLSFDAQALDKDIADKLVAKIADKLRVRALISWSFPKRKDDYRKNTRSVLSDATLRKPDFSFATCMGESCETGGDFKDGKTDEANLQNLTADYMLQASEHPSEFHGPPAESPKVLEQKGYSQMLFDTMDYFIHMGVDFLDYTGVSKYLWEVAEVRPAEVEKSDKDLKILESFNTAFRAQQAAADAEAQSNALSRLIEASAATAERAKAAAAKSAAAADEFTKSVKSAAAAAQAETEAAKKAATELQKALAAKARAEQAAVQAEKEASSAAAIRAELEAALRNWADGSGEVKGGGVLAPVLRGFKNLTEAEDIDVPYFFEVAEDFLKILEAMGPRMKLAVSDFSQNIEKFRRWHAKDPVKHSTLWGSLKNEKEIFEYKGCKGGARLEDQGACAVLWMRRSFEFTVAVFGLLSEGKSMADAAKQGYEDTLVKWHRMVLRNVFRFALMNVASREELCVKCVHAVKFAGPRIQSIRASSLRQNEEHAGKL